VDLELYLDTPEAPNGIMLRHRDRFLFPVYLFVVVRKMDYWPWLGHCSAIII
jgi:hypothetical protein